MSGAMDCCNGCSEKIRELTQALADTQECLEAAQTRYARLATDKDRWAVEVDKLAAKLSKVQRWEEDEIGRAGMSEQIDALEEQIHRKDQDLRGMKRAMAVALSNETKVRLEMKEALERVAELEAEIGRLVFKGTGS